MISRTPLRCRPRTPFRKPGKPNMHKTGHRHMLFSNLTVAAASAALFAAGASFAAELEIPPRTAPQDISVHKGPPNCSRWTDECVNCSRDAEGEAPVCSNIGFACQPQAIRCLSPVVPHSEPPKK